MGLAVKICLLLLPLVCGPVFGSSLVRQQRQADWWRHYQMPVPAQGSFRGASRAISSRPLVGLGSLRGSAQHRRGPNNWYSGGLPRQMPQQQPLSSPISIQCTENSIVVRVSRDFYGNGILVQPAELSLGSQSCKPSLQSNDTTTIIFLNDLQECGRTLQVTSDYLIYSSVLTYSPLANGVIIRSNPAAVPIHCIYPRHGNVSSKTIKPTWAPFSTTVSTQEKLLFSLTLMAEDWSGPRSSSVFQLGQSLNIEASVNTENHMSLIVFVDSCVATTSPDPNSSPNYDIIAANGCFMDAMTDATSSAFRSPRIQQDKLQFTLEAFRFKDVDVSVIYITCNLRAVPASQVPDAMNKACSFNRQLGSWSPVEGSSNICQCCFDYICERLKRRGPFIIIQRNMARLFLVHYW
ncbi:PREDICTED: zona pellucida sperm-binding protein 3-like [Nanorana parkeri]|uniref:zona pellucida sperm-binding protein 3-like n=1 Tax=Nanorana parkeri TaxID=125878 RepID=UPI000853F960|nr:PREDICTED: zona pellucida sperm-binding protein 3-like [Nanorana parkeri]